MTGTSDHLASPTERFLRVDERAEWLQEYDLDGHRLQSITAYRGEKLCKFTKDLGLALLYPKAHPFNFWAAGEYSVGEAMEIADRMRDNKPPEEREQTDLWGEYRKQNEEKSALHAHRSVVGPHITIQRN